MKAAVYKDIERLEIENIPIPACPKCGLLIKVIACGICGSDVRNFHNGLKGGKKNQIMGHEIAGIVVESDSPKFPVDSRVALAPDISCGDCWYCKRHLVNLCINHKMLGTHFPGGFAQYIPIEEVVLTHGFIEMIPENLDYKAGALAEVVAGVVACQQRVGVGLGDTVMILGDGPVACLHLEIARSRGASKVIIAGMDKLELAHEFKPDYMFKNNEPDSVSEEVMRITNGIGADFVISAVPSVKPQQQAIKLVRKRGTVILYGGVPNSARTTILDSNLIHYNEINLTGSFSYPSTGLSDALCAIAEGKITVEKYIRETVPLDNIVSGMDTVSHGKALKVMVDPWL